MMSLDARKSNWSSRLTAKTSRKSVVIGIPIAIGLLFVHVIVTVVAAVRAGQGRNESIYPFGWEFVRA